MLLTNVLMKKAKSKMILVMMESAVSGHSYNAVRDRLADKMEHFHWDPWIQRMSVYREKKKIKSIHKVF